MKKEGFWAGSASIFTTAKSVASIQTLPRYKNLFRVGGVFQSLHGEGIVGFVERVMVLVFGGLALAVEHALEDVVLDEAGAALGNHFEFFAGWSLKVELHDHFGVQTLRKSAVVKSVGAGAFELAQGGGAGLVAGLE